jgi:hypothetical protein
MTTVAGYILLGLGALISVGNWGLMLRWYIARKYGSMVPFIGGLASFAGCALSPAIGWKLGLLGLVVDPGCALLMVALPIDWVRRRSKEGS